MYGINRWVCQVLIWRCIMPSCQRRGHLATAVFHKDLRGGCAVSIPASMRSRVLARLPRDFRDIFIDESAADAVAVCSSLFIVTFLPVLQTCERPAALRAAVSEYARRPQKVTLAAGFG